MYWNGNCISNIPPSIFPCFFPSDETLIPLALRSIRVVNNTSSSYFFPPGMPSLLCSTAKYVSALWAGSVCLCLFFRNHNPGPKIKETRRVYVNRKAIHVRLILQCISLLSTNEQHGQDGLAVAASACKPFPPPFYKCGNVSETESASDQANDCHSNRTHKRKRGQGKGKEKANCWTPPFIMKLRVCETRA